MPFGMNPIKRHYWIGGEATILVDPAALGDLDSILIGGARAPYIADSQYAGDYPANAVRHGADYVMDGTDFVVHGA